MFPLIRRVVPLALALTALQVVGAGVAWAQDGTVEGTGQPTSAVADDHVDVGLKGLVEYFAFVTGRNLVLGEVKDPTSDKITVLSSQPASAEEAADALMQAMAVQGLTTEALSTLVQASGADGTVKTRSGLTPADVEPSGTYSFVVPRAMLDKVLSDTDSPAPMARALLHRGPDGTYDGYRLSGIRRGSFVDTLGIKNGDIIHAVNGLPLTSMQDAETALQSLRSEHTLNVQVTRRGQSLDLTYDIR